MSYKISPIPPKRVSQCHPSHKNYFLRDHCEKLRCPKTLNLSELDSQALALQCFFYDCK